MQRVSGPGFCATARSQAPHDTVFACSDHVSLRTPCVDSRMFRADKNGDGFITFPEFMTALEQNVNALSYDEASFLFQVCFGVPFRH